jgi:hypothetical protein
MGQHGFYQVIGDRRIKMRTISRDNYYQAAGLLSLLHQKARIMSETEQALANILGEEGDNGYYGHVSDAAFAQGQTIDELIGLLDIEVEDIQGG